MSGEATFDRYPAPPGTELAECRSCGFVFGSTHVKDDSGRESCPCCEELRLDREVRRLREELAAAQGTVAGYRRTLDEAFNSGDGTYRP